jgi:hypothetical protein
MDEVRAHLHTRGISIEISPIACDGAAARMTSLCPEIRSKSGRGQRR